MKTDTNATAQSTVQDYFNLLKPRVMTLVVFTGICGMILAPNSDAMHPFLMLIAIMALAIGAGASGAINMWYDRDIDAIMNRTKDRPIPAGRVPAAEGLTFAIVFCVFSVLVMALAVNYMAAGLLAFAIFDSIILFAIIFFWTPPHFWALSLYANEDYKRANIPMLTVTHGDKHTKIQMVIYTLILFPLCLAPVYTGMAGINYGIAAIILNALFILSAVQTFKETDGYKSARRMFGYSIFYLFAIFTALVLF